MDALFCDKCGGSLIVGTSFCKRCHKSRSNKKRLILFGSAALGLVGVVYGATLLFSMIFSSGSIVGRWELTGFEGLHADDFHDSIISRQSLGGELLLDFLEDGGGFDIVRYPNHLGGFSYDRYRFRWYVNNNTLTAWGNDFNFNLSRRTLRIDGLLTPRGTYAVFRRVN